ncbi:MAG: phosphate signaling complex protein PhoU [Nitratireductor sp.]
MTGHTVSAFDDDLKFIKRKITEMGGRAESMVEQAIAALIKGDHALAESVIAQDIILDNLQFELDERVIIVIAKRQPMAADLREIIGALRMGSDLERVGDMGKNIAKRAKEITEFTHPKKLVRGLEHLTSLALEQLKDALDAYVNKDEAKAELVLSRDDAIDQVYTSLFRELLTYMMEDPRNITFCTQLLFCAKNIERIGDHATNLAEIIRYIVTGKSELSKHGTRPE